MTHDRLHVAAFAFWLLRASVIITLAKGCTGEMTNPTVTESSNSSTHFGVSRMRRTFLGIIIFSTALLACGASTITDDLTPYGGDYTLRSVNGFPLPYAIQKTTAITLEITDETFSLTPSGGFVDITHYRRTQNPTVDFPSDTLRGTYTVRGQTANFTTSAGSVFSGTMGNSQFSIEGSSTILLYQK